MGMNGVGFSPRKMIKPISYNGVRSTGFKGVKVFQSHTQINKTIIIDNGGCDCGSSSKSKSSFWDKLAGIITGVGLGARLVGMIGKLFGGKDSDKGAVDNNDINTRIANEQAKQQKLDNDSPDLTRSERKTADIDKTLYGGQIPNVLVTGDASKAKKPLMSMSAGMKQDVAEEAKNLQGYYSSIIKDIQVEKQSDGTYKIRIVVPDTLKYTGDTAALNGTVKNSEELNDLVDKALSQLMSPQTAANPFAKTQDA